MAIETKRTPRVVSTVKASELHAPEYFNLVNGEPASLNKIREEHPMMDYAVASLHKHGDVIGQHEFTFTENGGIIFDIKLIRVKGVNTNDRNT